MAQTILISVILPTHNRVHMLERALGSILSQTYTHIEVIIVADACRDGTGEWLRKVKDDRVCFVETEKNVGGAKARNIGIDRAGGEYLAFLDDDDQWMPEKLARQKAALERHPDAAIISTSFVKRSGTTEKHVRYGRQYNRLEDCLYQNLPGSFSFCLIRRSDLDGARIDNRLVAFQDWDLWLSIMQRTQKHCLTLSEPLVVFNDHDEGRISTRTPKRLSAYRIFLGNHERLFQPAHRYYHLYFIRLEILRVYRLRVLEKVRLVGEGLWYLMKAKKIADFKAIEMLVGKLFRRGQYPKDGIYESLLCWRGLA